MSRPERLRRLAALARTLGDTCLDVAWNEEQDGAVTRPAADLIAALGGDVVSALAELREAGDL